MTVQSDCPEAAQDLKAAGSSCSVKTHRRIISAGNFAPGEREAVLRHAGDDHRQKIAGRLESAPHRTTWPAWI